MLSIAGKNVYLVAFAFYAIGCCIIFILCVLLIYQSFMKPRLKDSSIFNRQRQYIYNFYRITTAICFTAGLICGVFDTVHLYLCFKNDYLMLLGKYYQIKIISNFFWFCNSTSLNILLFGRVYFTFKDSYFALAKITIFIIVFQIITSIILESIFLLLGILFEDGKTSDKYSSPVLIALICNDLTVSISLLYLFAYKLTNTLITTAPIENAETSEKSLIVNANTDKDELPASTHSRQHKISITSVELQLIEVMTRHTILSAFAIIFNQLNYQFSLICQVYGNTFENSYGYGALLYGVRIYGMLGVVISLYFGMKFSKHLYFKCCSFCHQSCYKTCVKCTKYKKESR